MTAGRLSGDSAADNGIDAVTVLQTKGGLKATKTIWRRPGKPPIIDDYDDAKHFDVYEYDVSDLAGIARLLGWLETKRDRFIIRGRPLPGIDRRNARRLLHPKPNQPACFESAARSWIPVDLDKVPLPEGFDPLADPEMAVLWLVTQKLPEEFHSASCWWQFTSSAGIGPTGVISMRLLFWGSRPTGDAELKAWLPGTDHSIYTAVQPIYTARPIFEIGADPLPKRSGVSHRYCNVVPVPDAIAVPWRPQIIGTAATCDRLSPYGEAALLSAAEIILAAPKDGSSRDYIINREVFAIGTLAGAGGVPADLALDVLLTAATAECEERRRREVEERVRQSFADGLARPRPTPADEAREWARLMVEACDE